MKEEVVDKLAPKVEVHTLKPNMICSNHYFRYQTGSEVLCANCPLGYQLSPGATVKEGHIYIEDKLLI